MSTHEPPFDDRRRARRPREDWDRPRRFDDEDDAVLGLLGFVLRAIGRVWTGCGAVAAAAVDLVVSPSRSWARWIAWRDRHIPKPAVWDPAEQYSPHVRAFRPTTADLARPRFFTRWDLYSLAFLLGGLRWPRLTGWSTAAVWRRVAAGWKTVVAGVDDVIDAAGGLAAACLRAVFGGAAAAVAAIGGVKGFDVPAIDFPKLPTFDRVFGQGGRDTLWYVGTGCGLTALVLVALLFRIGQPLPALAEAAAPPVEDDFGGLPNVRPEPADEPLTVELASDAIAKIGVVSLEVDVVRETPPAAPEIDRLVTRAVRPSSGRPPYDDWTFAAAEFGTRTPRPAPRLQRVGFDDDDEPSLAPLPGPRDGDEVLASTADDSRVRVVVTRPDAAAAVSGTPHTYEIAVRNDGDTTVEGFAVTERIDAAVELLGCDPPARVDGRDLSWRLGPLTPGASEALRVTVLPTDGGRTLVGAAVVRSVVSAGAASDAVAGALRIVLTLPERVELGGACVGRLTVANVGEVSLSGVNIAGELPEGLKTAGDLDAFAAELGTLGPGQTTTRELPLDVAVGSDAGEVGGFLRAESAEGVVEDLGWSIALTPPRSEPRTARRPEPDPVTAAPARPSPRRVRPPTPAGFVVCPPMPPTPFAIAPPAYPAYPVAMGF